MKATIDIPDNLYRQVKAKCAIQGRSIREVTIELFEAWLKGEDAAVHSSGSKPKKNRASKISGNL